MTDEVSSLTWKWKIYKIKKVKNIKMTGQEKKEHG